MKLTIDELKQYLIENGKEKEVGVANNKTTTYYIENMIYDDINVNKVKYSIYMFSCYVYHYGCIDLDITPKYIRYNKKRDVVQTGIKDYWDTNIKWSDLSIKNENLYIFTDFDERNIYKDEYLNNHLDEYAKKCEQRIKEIQKIINGYQKDIKHYEKMLSETKKKLEEIKHDQD